MEELTESYSPKNVLFREEQIQQIQEVYADFQDGDSANRIAIGPTGSGKSVTIKKTLETLDRESYVYVSCADLRTSKKIFRKFSGCPDLSAAIEKFKGNRKIIILDEVNKISNLPEFFDDLNTFFRDTGCSFILITNKVTTRRKMPDDAKRTLWFEDIKFPPYNAVQIKEIILSRLQEAADNQKQIPAIHEDVIPYISALSSNEEYSMRFALKLLNQCIKREKYGHDEIKDIFGKIQTEEKLAWLESLLDNEKDLLRMMVRMTLEKQDNRMANDEILRSYQLFSKQRLSQVLSKFEDLDLIKSEITWEQGQKSKIISFQSEEDFNALVKFFEVNGHSLVAR